MGAVSFFWDRVFLVKIFPWEKQKAAITCSLFKKKKFQIFTHQFSHT